MRYALILLVLAGCETLPLAQSPVDGYAVDQSPASPAPPSPPMDMAGAPGSVLDMARAPAGDMAKPVVPAADMAKPIETPDLADPPAADMAKLVPDLTPPPPPADMARAADMTKPPPPPADMTELPDLTPPPCGKQGEACCTGSQAPCGTFLYCEQGSHGNACMPCGAAGQPVCGGFPQCQYPNTPVNGFCVAPTCGVRGKPCCSPSQCGGGVTCCTDGSTCFPNTNTCG